MMISARWERQPSGVLLIILLFVMAVPASAENDIADNIFPELLDEELDTLELHPHTFGFNKNKHGRCHDTNRTASIYTTVNNDVIESLAIKRLRCEASQDLPTISASELKIAGSSTVLQQRFSKASTADADMHFSKVRTRHPALVFNGMTRDGTAFHSHSIEPLSTFPGSHSATGEDGSAGEIAVPDAIVVMSEKGVEEQMRHLLDTADIFGPAGTANRIRAQLSPAANVFATTQVAVALTQAVVDEAFLQFDHQRMVQNGNEFATSQLVIWGRVFGGRSIQNQRDGVSGYHANYSGLLTGVDTGINMRWRIGAQVNYAGAWVHSKDANEGSSADINSYGVLGYGSYTGQPEYLNLLVGVIRQQYDTPRAIAFKGVTSKTTGIYPGMQYIAAVQFGRPITMLSGAILTPLAGLSYSHLHQNAYTESGGNIAALRVEKNKNISVRSHLAMRLEKSFVYNGGTVRPWAQLGWRHEHRATRQRVFASFVGMAVQGHFSTQVPAPVSDMGALTLGVTFLGSKNFQLSARYAFEAGSSYKAHTGDLLASWQF